MMLSLGKPKPLIKLMTSALYAEVVSFFILEVLQCYSHLLLLFF